MVRTQRMRAWLPVVFVVAAVVGAPATSDARVRDCRTNVAGYLPHLNLVTVTSARNMTCAEAAIAVKRGPIRVRGGNAIRIGGRFTIGRYMCTTTSGSYESFASRCVRNARAFRIAWGS